MTTSFVARAAATTASAVVITSFPSVPLTTTFKPSADCSGFYFSHDIFVIDASSSCLPSGFDTNPTSYFSPGIACPSGYSTACHDTTGVSTITTVTCCPVRGDVSLSCVPNPLSLADVWSTLFCTWIAPDTTTLSVTLSSNGVTSTSLGTFVSPGGINALGIRMVYQSSDLSTSTSSTSKPASNTAQTTSSTSSSSTSSSSPTSTPSSGLSTGAKAAIGVSIPLAVLAILVGVFLWWRRRSQRYNAVGTGQPAYHSPTTDNKAPPLYGGDPVYELGTPQPELMGDSPRPQQAHAELTEGRPQYQAYSPEES